MTEATIAASSDVGVIALWFCTSGDVGRAAGVPGLMDSPPPGSSEGVPTIFRRVDVPTIFKLAALPSPVATVASDPAAAQDSMLP